MRNSGLSCDKTSSSEGCTKGRKISNPSNFTSSSRGLRFNARDKAITVVPSTYPLPRWKKNDDLEIPASLATRLGVRFSASGCTSATHASKRSLGIRSEEHTSELQ